MTQGPWQRRAPLAGAVFAVLMVAAFFIAGSSPDTTASNAKITAYVSDSSKQDHNLIGILMVLVAIMFLIVFYAALRERLVLAGRGGAGTLAFGAGIASAVFLFTAIAMFVSTLITAQDADKFPLDPAFFRFTQDLGYLFWVASAVVGSLVVWATSSAVLGAGLLPRWFGWFGVVAGILILFSIFFFPIFLYWLWILMASILLFASPVEAAPVTATAV